MSDTNSRSNKITAADVPLALKARYFASGLVVGVFISPNVRRTLAKLQPQLDQLLDSLTGQAEGLAEKGSDILARAKDLIRRDSHEEHTPAPARRPETTPNLTV